MLTLTYRENVTDRDRVLREWKRFCRGMRGQFGCFSYVAVLERQQRGCFHVHAAIKGFYDVKVVRALWLSICGSGNVDIGRSRVGASKRMARYMAKYLAKDFEEGELNRKRYWASEKISVCHVLNRLLDNDQDDVAGVEEIMRSLGFEREASDFFKSDGGGVLWMST